MPKILIMGLPGSGKTTLAKLLSEKLMAKHINADEVRKTYNDWDFSKEGRLRQAERMKTLSNLYSTYYVVVDFVAALKEQRDIFGADFTIWMNTIEKGRFADTNDAFEPPLNADFVVTTKDAGYWVELINNILKDNPQPMP